MARSDTHSNAPNRHALILNNASKLFSERDEVHQSSYKNGGWRANLVKLRTKIERCFPRLWDADLELGSDHIDVDDLYDIINYAAFCIELIEDGNRDGNWW